MSDKNNLDIDREIESIIEKKVKEKIERNESEIVEEAEKRVRKNLKDKASDRISKNDFKESKNNKSKISRRKFLKKAGLGLAGLGALGISPISALEINKDDILKDGSSILGGNVDDGFGSGLTADMIGSNSSDPSSPSDSRIWIKDGSNKSELKIQLRGETKVLAKESDIPDSTIGLYDFRKEDGSLPVEDRSGNGNDLGDGGYSGVSATINGYQAGSFDGSSDTVGTTNISQSQPLTIIVVAETSVTKEQHMVSGNHPSVYRWSNDEWRAYANSRLDGSTNQAKLITAYFNGSNSYLREDGTETVTGDTGSDNLAQLYIGSQADTGRYWDGAIGYVEVHDGEPSNGVSTREQEIANKFDITL